MNTESTFKGLYDLLASVWNGVPWHLFEVSFEVVWSSVISDKNDLDLALGFFITVDGIVEFVLECAGEEATWWCPMSSEIKADVFSLC